MNKIEAGLLGFRKKDDGIAAIHSWLPNENPVQQFETLVQWGRFGELIGFSADTGVVYLDR